MDILKRIERREMSKNVSGDEFIKCQVGEVYTVYYLMVGGTRMRKFTGVCIGKRRKGINSSITLRNIVAGMGIEYSFNVYSGRIVGIERVIKERKLSRRAKMYNLKEKGIKLSRV